MPRRKRSGSNSLPIIIGAAVIVALAGVAFFFLKSDSEPFPDIEHLKQDLYVRDATSLQGTFKVYGKTVGKVDYETAKGSIWEVDVRGWKATGSGTSSPRVGILVPNSLTDITLKPAQEFAFKVSIARDKNQRGILIAQEITSL